ncbi:hypothetical protein [Kalamiella sp. sgz302252]|uniref:hypothetical protein n=1 Tax=Pantoea sp. sgz302252 TaxID=3341827 RepID=UPI0036D2DACC
MKKCSKKEQAIASHINEGREAGLARVTGTTPEEIRASFMRTFRNKDIGESRQVKGLHGHSEKKHILG